jgi:hypothetical protein
VAAAYRNRDLRLERRLRLDNWSILVFTRPGTDIEKGPGWSFTCRALQIDRGSKPVIGRRPTPCGGFPSASGRCRSAAARRAPRADARLRPSTDSRARRRRSATGSSAGSSSTAALPLRSKLMVAMAFSFFGSGCCGATTCICLICRHHDTAPETRRQPCNAAPAYLCSPLLKDPIPPLCSRHSAMKPMTLGLSGCLRRTAGCPRSRPRSGRPRSCQPDGRLRRENVFADFAPQHRTNAAVCSRVRETLERLRSRTSNPVMPAKAGIQWAGADTNRPCLFDPGLSRGDGIYRDEGIDVPELR